MRGYGTSVADAGAAAKGAGVREPAGGGFVVPAQAGIQRWFPGTTGLQERGEDADGGACGVHERGGVDADEHGAREEEPDGHGRRDGQA